MKKCLLFIASLFLSTFSIAQDWSALGDGAGTNNEILEAIAFQGDLVIAGKFIQAGNLTVNRIARWDGAAWHPMGTGFNGEVRALAVFEGELYAAGYYDADGTGTLPLPGMAKWNGSSWIQVPVPDPLSYDYRDLYVFEGDLYTTRHSSNPDFRVRVSKFDGNSWSDLPGEFFGPVNYKYLYTLGEYQGKLVAGGVFDSVSGATAQRVALFNGSTWESLGFPVQGETTSGILEGKAFALKEFEDKLYVGGIFTAFQDTVPSVCVASFDGTTWTPYPFDDNVSNIIHDLEKYNDKLIASGELALFQGGQVVAGCAMLDPESSSTWSNLGFYNPASSDLSGQDMAIVDGDLYIAGKFSHAGSSPQPVRNVARFDGNLPTALTETISDRGNLSLYPNPAGEFLRVTLPESLPTGKSLHYRIMDYTGRTVGEGVFSGSTLRVGHLPAGLYVLTLTGSHGTRTAPFAVK